jgi:hypothetical protein
MLLCSLLRDSSIEIGKSSENIRKKISFKSKLARKLKKERGL